MKRNHRSYSNLQYWKVEPIAGGFAIVPAPNGGLMQLVLTIPGAGVFYWALHHKLEIQDSGALMLADFALLLGVVASLVVYLFNRRKALKDKRPYLEVSTLTEKVSFPRLSKSYPLGGDSPYLIAYDFDADNFYSELNLIEVIDGEEKSHPLLHQLERCKSFDRIGEHLKELGLPYQFREHSTKSRG